MSYQNKGQIPVTVIMSQEPDRSGNYVCDGTNDEVQINAAFAYLDLIGGGIIYFKNGIYSIDADVQLPSTDRFKMVGESRVASSYTPHLGAGVLFDIAAGAQFRDPDDGGRYHLELEDIGFRFSGTVTASPFYFPDTLLHSHNCLYDHEQDQDVSRAMVVGSAGPPASPFIWNRNVFVDQRTGGADRYLMNFHTEEGVFNNTTWLVNWPAGMTGARGFRFEPANSLYMNSWSIFTSAAWDTAGRQYDQQFAFASGNINVIMENIQFFEPADISNANIISLGVDTYITGKNPMDFEGVSTIVVPSVGGAGTVHLWFTGRGWVSGGTATILNGAASVVVPHGLVGTPTEAWACGAVNSIEVGQLTTHTWGGAGGNITVQKVSAGNVTGDRLISWGARLRVDA